MAICSVEEAVEDIRQGRMIILVDDEDRRRADHRNVADANRHACTLGSDGGERQQRRAARQEGATPER